MRPSCYVILEKKNIPKWWIYSFSFSLAFRSTGQKFDQKCTRSVQCWTDQLSKPPACVYGLCNQFRNQSLVHCPVCVCAACRALGLVSEDVALLCILSNSAEISIKDLFLVSGTLNHTNTAVAKQNAKKMRKQKKSKCSCGGGKRWRENHWELLPVNHQATQYHQSIYLAYQTFYFSDFLSPAHSPYNVLLILAYLHHIALAYLRRHPHPRLFTCLNMFAFVALYYIMYRIWTCSRIFFNHLLFFLFFFFFQIVFL